MFTSVALAAVIGPSSSAEFEARMKWFQEARLGMFIHWGPVSLKGTEIGWSRGAQVPNEEYDQLFKQFNPTLFDADEWMQLAKDAGMKYVVPTAKHHDGFCIWPTKTTDYNIMNSPFKRDIMGELAGASRRRGLAFCSYFSILDWWHPQYGTGSPGGQGKKPQTDMKAFMEYSKAQLGELIKNYKLKMVWFDGQWEGPYTAEMAADLEKFSRGLSPKIILNNRVGKVRLDGDYDTPEQQVGSFQRDRPWETCMTLCTQWAWKPNDKLKSFDEVIKILVQTVTGDGNLLLNVGPTPEGTIEPRQAERLRELGSWLKKHGESIYKTRGGPYVNGEWGGATCRGKSVYLHLLGWKGEILRFKLLPGKVVKFKSLTGNPVRVTEMRSGLTVEGSAQAANPYATVIKIDLDVDAVKISPIKDALVKH